MKSILIYTNSHFFIKINNIHRKKTVNCYFFGTFNPIHLGHIEISKRIKEALNFDKVIFVPSFMPPHKFSELASFKDRFNMVSLAVGADNVSDIESKLKPPSYTYRTIEYLCGENNTDKINFIIGYDQFFKIESWREPEILKEKLNFIVYPRKFKNGQTLSTKAFDYLKNKGYDFEIVNLDFLDISSEMIRKLRQEGKDITGLTTKEVREYIENTGIYTKMAQRKPIG